MFRIQVISGNFLSNVQNWFSDNVESQLEVRAPLKDTGYWNFLTIGGIYGRMLHFMLTDSEGFGNEIKVLNANFKEEYGAEYYTELESHVAENFPIADTLYQLMTMVPKISSIRDEKTQKTLGDAIYILKNIANDRKAVNVIVDRWHMVKKIANIFKNPEDEGLDDAQVNKLKILLLEHPEVFQKLLAQPDVLNRLSGSVLESLKGIDLIKAVESIQEMALLLKTLHPENYEEITEQLLQIRDEKTNLSFAEGLETISNVIKTQVFQNKLRLLLDTDVLQQVHETSQQPLANAMKKLDPKQALNKANPVMIQKHLKTQGIIVSVEKTQSLLEDAKNDQLLEKLLRVVENAEDVNGNLTPESISNSLATVQIYVDPENITRVMHLLQMFSPAMILNRMKSVGIAAKMSDLQKLVKQAWRAAPLVTESFDTKETPTPPADTSVPSSETSSPPVKIPSKL